MKKSQLKELIKKAHMKEGATPPQLNKNNLKSEFESKLKSHDWYHMMSDDNAAHIKGSAEESELKKIAKELVDSGHGDAAADMYNRYNKFKGITFDQYIAPTQPFISRFKRKQMGLDETEFSKQFDNNPALKGGQKNLPDALQKSIVKKTKEDLKENLDVEALALTFKDSSEFERAKEHFESTSDFYPFEINDEFRTFLFQAQDQADADSTEFYLTQELEGETDLRGYYFSTESSPLNEENTGLADIEEMGYEAGEAAFEKIKSRFNNKPDHQAYRKGFFQGYIDNAGSYNLNEGEVDLGSELSKDFESIISKLKKYRGNTEDQKWIKTLGTLINILQTTEDKFSEYSRKMGVIPTINETHSNNFIGEDLDLGHQDNEPHMLKGDLYRIGKYAMELYQMVDEFEYGHSEVDFPHWWQSKIIRAKEMVSSAKHYLDFELKEPAIDAMVGVASDEEIIDENINRMYYHVLEDGGYGRIGHQGYYNTQEEAQKRANTLSDMFPKSDFYVEAYPSKEEPVTVTMEENTNEGMSEEEFAKAKEEDRLEKLPIDQQQKIKKAIAMMKAEKKAR